MTLAMMSAERDDMPVAKTDMKRRLTLCISPPKNPPKFKQPRTEAQSELTSERICKNIEDARNPPALASNAYPSTTPR